MSRDAVISIQNVSKAYRMWETPSARLTVPMMESAARILPGGQALRARAASRYRDFWALRDISFELKRGEAIGIIGRNGSGKSTLLQIIAGTLQASRGTVKVTGRVAALLELGSGFNPDFTGRENVYLSAAVLGLSRAEIDARFDEIVAFADIGDFVDQPVKTYSSGMMVRLAFAVNTCVDPDILMVDEALSVGDAPFQAKCFRRLRQLIEKGVSLLFVSHDIGTVRSICSRALWLKSGQAEMWGEAKTVAKEYEKFCWQESGVQAVAAPRDLVVPKAAVPSAEAPPPEWQQTVHLLEQHNHLLPITDPGSRLGNGSITLEALVLTNAAGDPARQFEYDETVGLSYRIRAHAAIDSECIIGIRLRDKHGNHVLSIQDLKTIHRLKLAAGETAHVRTFFRLPLTHGDYILRTGLFGFRDGLARPDGIYDFGRAELWDVREDAAHLTIRPWSEMPLAGPVHFSAAFSFLLPK